VKVQHRESPDTHALEDDSDLSRTQRDALGTSTAR
jgi:hypothetical protein